MQAGSVELYRSIPWITPQRPPSTNDTCLNTAHRVQSVANKGEPYLSGLEDSPEGVQLFVGLHGFRLQQYMSPRCASEGWDAGLQASYTRCANGH